MVQFGSKTALVFAVVFILAVGSEARKLTAREGDGDPDYPDIVAIFGTSPSQNYTTATTKCFGEYSKMENQSSNGKPVWKHNSREDRVLFYDQNNFWLVGGNYESNDGFMASKYRMEEQIPRRSWRRSTGGSFHDDSSLIVEVTCAESVNLTTPWAEYSGTYHKTDQEAKGRAVWKFGEKCLWWATYAHWWTGPCDGNLGKNAGQAWLENRTMCPYVNGYDASNQVWRRAGTDEILPLMKASSVRNEGDLETLVICGEHRAESCAACPREHGASWCNGDCFWKSGQCKSAVCRVTRWTAWSPCSHTCGSGSARRTREIIEENKGNCPVLIETTECLEKECIEPLVTAFSLPGTHLLSKKSLLTSLTTLGKAWVVSFSLFPTDYSFSHWTNCLQLRAGEDDDQSILLDISFRGKDGMRIKTREFSGGSEVKEVDLPLLPEAAWTEVKVEKKTGKSTNTYRIYINGTVAQTFTEKNKRFLSRTREELNEVNVYASAPGRKSQPGKMKGLTVDIAGYRGDLPKKPESISETVILALVVSLSLLALAIITAACTTYLRFRRKKTLTEGTQDDEVGMKTVWKVGNVVSGSVDGTYDVMEYEKVEEELTSQKTKPMVAKENMQDCEYEYDIGEADGTYVQD